MYHIITWDLRQNVIQMYMYIFVPVKMKIIYWSCPCVGLVRWLVGSLQIFLEVLFWMLSDVPHHYLRFETECHTDVHVHICSCQNENYLLVMSMCGTGQMTCRKPANIFRSTILDAKWCTTSLLEIWDRMSYRLVYMYIFFYGFDMSGRGLEWHVNNLWTVWTGFCVNNHKINFLRRCEGFYVLRKFCTNRC